MHIVGIMVGFFEFPHTLLEICECVVSVEGDTGAENIHKCETFVFHTSVHQFGEMLRVAAESSGNVGGARDNR